MKRFLLLAPLLVAAAPPANVAMENGTNRQVTPVAIVAESGSGLAGQPLGYQQITNLQLATVQSLTVPAGATHAVIQNNGNQPIRYRDDGPAPTTTLGQRLDGGGNLIDYHGDLQALRMVREVDGATLDILYYR